jgi:hypothetical protein
MVAVPALPPVTTPDGSTVAMDGALELQLPPPVAELNVVARPGHTPDAPMMDAGCGLTTNDLEVRQLVGNV